MKDCAGAVKVTSELQDYARNEYGNLAAQKRELGPFAASTHDATSRAAPRSRRLMLKLLRPGRPESLRRNC